LQLRLILKYGLAETGSQLNARGLVVNRKRFSMKMKSAMIPLSPGRHHHCLILMVASWLAAFLISRADERLFTYVQEAEVLPKGGLLF